MQRSQISCNPAPDAAISKTDASIGQLKTVVGITNQTPQRTNILTRTVDAGIDVRKACNTIKRMTSICTASMVSGLDPNAAVEASREMAVQVLQSIGFNIEDEPRLESVLPMMMEATSLVLADSARKGTGREFDISDLRKAASSGVIALSAVAKSRIVAKMIEPAWPTDIDAITALRLSASAAMAHISIEVSEFDFMHSATECIKEAGKTVIKAATEASAAMAPLKTPASARLTLTQSLISSASKMYAAAWHSEAKEQSSYLDSLTEIDVGLKLDQMEKASLSTLLIPVNAKFTAAFGAVISSANEMFARPNDADIHRMVIPSRHRYSK